MNYLILSSALPGDARGWAFLVSRYARSNLSFVHNPILRLRLLKNVRIFSPLVINVVVNCCKNVRIILPVLVSSGNIPEIPISFLVFLIRQVLSETIIFSEIKLVCFPRTCWRKIPDLSVCCLEISFQKQVSHATQQGFPQYSSHSYLPFDIVW